MFRFLGLISLVGMTFCLNAFAQGDDAEFACRFESNCKTGPICQAYGRFDVRMPHDTQVHWGDRDDGLRITCTDPITGHESLIYSGTIGTQLRPDSDDFDHVIDTRFLGRTIDAPRFIDVDDLRWKSLNGVYRARLSFGTLPMPLTQVSGFCEFRR